MMWIETDCEQKDENPGEAVSNEIQFDGTKVRREHLPAKIKFQVL
jgi:hypothetical protein